MGQQLILSISREYGSGGRAIAEKLASRYQLPFFDYNLLQEIAKEKHLDSKTLERYDELSRKAVFSRTVRGYSNSPEENIAQMQFDFLRRKAAAGESFVIVGRCAETILKDYKGMVSFFVLGDPEVKVKRIMETKSVDEAEARELIRVHDRKRKSYHNHFCPIKWGDSRNYEISINSSKLGINRTAEVMGDYIDIRMEEMKQ